MRSKKSIAAALLACSALALGAAACSNAEATGESTTSASAEFPSAVELINSANAAMRIATSFSGRVNLESTNYLGWQGETITSLDFEADLANHAISGNAIDTEGDATYPRDFYVYRNTSKEWTHVVKKLAGWTRGFPDEPIMLDLSDTARGSILALMTDAVASPAPAWAPDGIKVTERADAWVLDLEIVDLTMPDGAVMSGQATVVIDKSSKNELSEKFVGSIDYDAVVPSEASGKRAAASGVDELTWQLDFSQYGTNKTVTVPKEVLNAPLAVI